MSNHDPYSDFALVVAELKSNFKNESIVIHKEQPGDGRRAWRKREMPAGVSVSVL